MADMLVKDSYPYLEDIPKTVESAIPPMPYYFMPVRDGEYPHCYTVPDIIDSTVTPAPYYFIPVRDGEYPHYYNVPDTIKGIIEPQPYYFFGQKDNFNNGYPFIKMPELIMNRTRPLPYLIHEPPVDLNEYKAVVILDRVCMNKVISDL